MSNSPVCEEAIEDSAAEAENMKLRSILMKALREHIANSDARF
jgi:predicted XRE-type DNA-binding protein